MKRLFPPIGGVFLTTERQQLNDEGRDISPVAAEFDAPSVGIDILNPA